jgi:predicted nucleic acid-binding protein
MIVFVLDSSAVIRFIDHEAGAERVKAVIQMGLRGSAEVQISAIQWGEIAGVVRKRLGAPEQERVLQRLLDVDLHIVSVSADRAERAAGLRIDRKLPYADAFTLDLAMDSPDHMLVTADYDFKAVADMARIEFLPAK